MELAKKEINNMLTAQVDFSNLKLSFIRNFPNAYIALEDLSVVGTGDFDGDTLVAFDKLSLTVDLMSVISLKNIEVKSVLLDKANLYAHILKDGRPNWDIMKVSEEEVEEPETEDAALESDINVALKKFEIRNANIVYNDEAGGMKAAIGNLNFFLKGDMSLDNTILALTLDIEALDFWMDGIRMMKKAGINFK
jgi:uncharacterized protein involved in outer membrane biogenesis